VQTGDAKELACPKRTPGDTLPLRPGCYPVYNNDGLVKVNESVDALSFEEAPFSLFASASWYVGLLGFEHPVKQHNLLKIE
jgi:hypothetical protein